MGPPEDGDAAFVGGEGVLEVLVLLEEGRVVEDDLRRRDLELEAPVGNPRVPLFLMTGLSNDSDF